MNVEYVLILLMIVQMHVPVLMDILKIVLVMYKGLSKMQ